MIKVITEPDYQFGLKLDENGEEYPVRIAFIEDNSGLTTPDKYEYLLTPKDDPDLLRNPDGSLIHPKRDVHWEFVENGSFKDSPRELLNKKIDRGAGKCGNFQIPYGGQEGLLERKLEVDTGVKPEPGTGAKIQKTYTVRYPQATAYLEERELDPELIGEFRSVTGAVRKYHVYQAGEVSGLSEYARNAMINPLKREARNWPVQSLVADTLAKAVVKLNTFYIINGLKSRVITPLYDACYSMSPIEERWIAHKAHQHFMADVNTWELHGRTLKFDIETEFSIHWSTPLSVEDKKNFMDKTWKVKEFDNLIWDV